MTQIIPDLAAISDRYDALFVDLWGCVHDGVRPHDTAVAALKAFRARGGAVVLLTNSPRPRDGVERQLAHIGVDPDAWDTIATSGDSARAAMFEGAVGAKLHHIGPPEERVFFAPMKLIDNPVPVELVALEDAEGLVATGLDDDTRETPEDYRATLLYAKQKGLKLLCANPDIVVDRGRDRVYCAGALAQLYTQMGGESLYFGKPHPPIYDLARRRLAALGRDVGDAAILAIGDGIHTDIQGALGENLDALFITGGLAAQDTATAAAPQGQPDPEKLQAYQDQKGFSATFAMGFLR
ncbi:TIGR01459 family HAD-type hydrolase [Brevirhabdus sp.]|uniref:TIGR01459 family HAD-type hydrolase n=1 Tax=Brevirhabdus sp. TaxID=2004514 RepID=UPI004057FD13